MIAKLIFITIVIIVIFIINIIVIILRWLLIQREDQSHRSHQQAGHAGPCSAEIRKAR
jgi:hypothetical protein